MNVLIIKEGSTVPVTTINVRAAIGGMRTEEEMKNLAWEAAVDNGVVNGDERQQYTFVVMNE